MALALEEARAAAREGEVPIGAVVVYDGSVVARAHNRREAEHDPSAHAEFSAMCAAAQALGRWRLAGCTVYVTLEPCSMCAGLMVNARIDRCVFGAADPKAGALGSVLDLSCQPRLNHAFAVTSGVMAEACAAELQDFFGRLRRDAVRAERSDAAEAELAAQARITSAAGRERRMAEARPVVAVVMDSFKGSAASAQVERWTAEGVRKVCPHAEVACLAVGDGGEGTLDALEAALGGTMHTVAVEGPLGVPVPARYLTAHTAEGRAAVIEMAEAAGISYSPRTPEAALAASTYGVGQLMVHALDQGVDALYIAVGGSATSDGGAGMLQALGAHIVDAEGCDIPRGLAGLADVTSIDLAPVCERFAGRRVEILSDVSSPLVGKRGAAQLFGPQKGIAPEDAPVLDAWMVRFGRALDAARAACPQTANPAARRFSSVLGVPGAGAAGGLGAALLSVGARLVSGAEAVLDLIGVDDLIARADLVITGEGHLDSQSVDGKLPVAVGRRCKRQATPCIALVGGRADDVDAAYGAGIGLVLPVLRQPMGLEQACTAEETRRNLVCAGESALRAFFLSRPEC